MNSGCISEKKFKVRVYGDKGYAGSYEINYNLIKYDGSVINKKFIHESVYIEEFYGKEFNCSIDGGRDIVFELWVNDELRNKEVLRGGEIKISYK